MTLTLLNSIIFTFRYFIKISVGENLLLISAFLIAFNNLQYKYNESGLNAKIHLQEKQELQLKMDFKGTADIQVF